MGSGLMEDMVDRRIDSLVMRHCAVARKVKRCHGLEAVDRSLGRVWMIGKGHQSSVIDDMMDADWVLFIAEQLALNSRT